VQWSVVLRVEASVAKIAAVLESHIAVTQRPSAATWTVLVAHMVMPTQVPRPVPVEESCLTMYNCKGEYVKVSVGSLVNFTSEQRGDAGLLTNSMKYTIATTHGRTCRGIAKGEAGVRRRHKLYKIIHTNAATNNAKRPQSCTTCHETAIEKAETRKKRPSTIICIHVCK